MLLLAGRAGRQLPLAGLLCRKAFRSANKLLDSLEPSPYGDIMLPAG